MGEEKREQETVRLYTRQNDKTLYQLKRDGRIINQRIYVQLHFGDIAPLFMESYDWFTKKASAMVAKPDDVHAPIWCSISRENCLKPIPGTVVYVLDVPKEQVIYFDDEKWDYVLNRIYLPKDMEDREAYRRHLKEIGWTTDLNFSRAGIRVCTRRKSAGSGRAGTGSLRSTAGLCSMCAEIYGKSGRNGCSALYIPGKM